jgi:uncharacterized protein (DUF2147 family)
MKRSLVLSAAATLSLVSMAVFANPAPVTGQWKTVDEKGAETGVIEIYEQGGKVFGKLVSVKEPLDAQGKPKLCNKCSGADKDKPIVGLVILKGLSADGDEYNGGTITDPNSGDVYKAKIEAVEGGKKLKVRGFLGISLLGRTQVWLKK